MDTNYSDEISDSEMWRSLREDSIRKRWDNYKKTLKLLDSYGITYIVLSASTSHIRIGDYDMWPTTGKFINRKTKKSGRGVFNLLNRIYGKRKTITD